MVNVPIYLVKFLLLVLSFFINFDQVTWDDKLVSGLDFLANSVLQIPFVLMTLMSHLTPTLDNLFMDSLQWVDQTYVQKHHSDDPKQLRAMYYPNLRMYSTHGPVEKKKKAGLVDTAIVFAERYGKRAAISLAIYALSFVPVIGRFVLPAASCYTFNKAVGPVPAAIVFGGGMFLPRRYLVSFLQTYFASRNLMRELVMGKKSNDMLNADAHDSYDPISPGCISPQNKRKDGSLTAAVSYSAFRLHSLSW